MSKDTVSEEIVEQEVIEQETEAQIEELVEEGSVEALTIEEQLAQVSTEAQMYKDKWMRAVAEFSNAKRRMEKERLEIYGNSLADVVGKFLPALDDYDRAIANVPAEIAENSWYEGVTLVQRKFNAILEGLNVEKMVAVGEPFDPMLHEAVLQEPSDDYESGLVIRELQSGYQRGDRVIRPAMVVVSA